MSAPRRVINPDTALKPVAAGADDRRKIYFDHLIKYVPIEIIVIYFLGIAVFKDPILLVALTIICFVLVIVFMAIVTADPAEKKPPSKTQIFVACVSFLLWAYSFGVAFQPFGLYYPEAGAFVLLVWTFFSPILFKGEKE